ncbi:MAG: M23 family metallopeptidase [Bellilinea sp.]
MPQRFSGLSIVALALIVLGIFSVLSDRCEPTRTYAAAVPLVLAATPTLTPFQPLPTPLPTAVELPPVVNEDPPDRPEDIRLPYDDYILTQRTHGAAYGDAAIDLAAGPGMDILSPISGQVTRNGFDMYGNSILIIENEVWQVKLLHGAFYPAEGDWVGMGNPIGIESNLGYTYDIYGRSCWRRSCGFHTHMNVVDRRTGQNADLMKLLDP